LRKLGEPPSASCGRGHGNFPALELPTTECVNPTPGTAGHEWFSNAVQQYAKLRYHIGPRSFTRSQFGAKCKA